MNEIYDMVKTSMEVRAGLFAFFMASIVAYCRGILHMSGAGVGIRLVNATLTGLVAVGVNSAIWFFLNVPPEEIARQTAAASPEEMRAITEKIYKAAELSVFSSVIVGLLGWQFIEKQAAKIINSKMKS